MRGVLEAIEDITVTRSNNKGKSIIEQLLRNPNPYRNEGKKLIPSEVEQLDECLERTNTNSLTTTIEEVAPFDPPSNKCDETIPESPPQVIRNWLIEKPLNSFITEKNYCKTTDIQMSRLGLSAPVNHLSYFKGPDDQAPRFLTPINRDRIIIKEGERFELKTNCTGFPFPNFKWFADGREIVRNRIIEQNDNRSESTLTIREVEGWHQGRYKCFAGNYCGYDSVEIDVKVLTKPTQPVGPLAVSNIEATSCTLNWSPPTFDGGSPIHEYWVQVYNCESETWSSAIKTTNHQIVIKELIEDMNYRFRVQAWNGVKASNALKTNKPIRTQKPIPPPSAPLTPRITGYNEEDLVIAWDPPSQAEDLLGYVVEYRSAMANASVWKSSIIQNNTQTHTTISGVPISRIYVFRVKAYNRSGPSEYSDIITNKMQPTLSSLPDEMTFIEGDDIVVSVKFTGLPFPTVIWRRNNVKIYAAARVHIISDEHHSSLFIDKAIPEDSSTVEVTVHNSAGEQRQSTKIVVLPLPPPGAPLTTEQTLNNSIMLSWQPPSEDTLQSIAGYVLDSCEIKDSCEDNWEVCAVLAATEQQFQVMNLSEGKYKFRLSTYRSNKHSTYIYSDEVIVEAIAKPPSCPGKPYIIDYNENDIKLKWAPPEEDGGAPVTSYAFKVKKVSEIPFKTFQKSVDKDNCEAEITGFVPNAKVSFQAIAINKAGQSPLSPPSEEHLVRSKDAIPKIINKENNEVSVRFGGAYHFESDITGERPITIKWSRVETGKDLNNDNHFKIRNSLSNTKLSLLNVSHEHHGVYQLIASNAWGSDSILIKINVISCPSRPAGPLEIKAIDDTGLLLKWKAPDSTGNLPLTHYVVSKHNISRDNWLVINPQTMDTELTVRGLIKRHRYSFHVRAVNKEGQSPTLDSDIIVAHGGTSEQTHKLKPRIIDFNESNVTIVWDTRQNTSDVGSYLIKKRILKSLLYQRLENVIYELDQLLPAETTSATVKNLTEGEFVQIQVLEVGVNGKVIASEVTPFHRVRQKFCPPKISKPFEKQTTCRYDANLQFIVRVHGEPNPTFKWFSNGLEIINYMSSYKIRNSFNQTYLEIKGVKKHHEGKYKLVASNEHGTDESETEIIIVSKPVLPRVLMGVSNVTSTGCKLKWIQFKFHTKVDYFLIEYNDLKPDKWIECSRTDPDKTECEITSLSKGGSYKFRLRAVNIAGKSDPIFSRFVKLSQLDKVLQKKPNIMSWMTAFNDFDNSDETVVYRAGQPISIRMTYEGTSRPRIIIHKDGQVMTEPNFQVYINTTNIVLTKEHATRLDSGRYLIEGKIEDISDVNDFRLIVVDVPTRPRQPFEVRYLNDKTIQCSWKHSLHDGGSPIIGYILERKKSGQEKWEKLYENRWTHCRIETKSEEGSYSYRISAVNQYETSKYLTIIKPFEKGKREEAKRTHGQKKNTRSSTLLKELFSLKPVIESDESLTD